ncbi:MAG: M48 family metallopeptidase [Mariprofundaceae bacterium]
MLFTTLFLGALLLSVLVDLWLDQRHIRAVSTARECVPECFAASVSLASHRKAADYTLAKMQLGKWNGLYSITLLLCWTLLGGLNQLDEFIRIPDWSPLWSGILFLGCFFLISALLELPFSLYRTFCIEQKFGFNRMTAGLYISDMAKKLVLMLVIGTPVAWVILWLMNVSGSLWWLWAWGAWSSFSLLMMWVFPTLIAPLFNKFSPMPEGEQKNAIATLLKRCGFDSHGLYVMDGSKRSSHGNAYFTGFGKSKRIVFYDTLLKQLHVNETVAVLAHELGHFRCNHIKKRILMMFASSLIGFALLGWVADQAWFYSGLGVSQPSDYMLLILFILAMPVFTFALTPLMNLYSRKHEFEADDYAKKHADAADLITALVKMYDDNAATLTPDPLYSAWHDSHPPATIRISHLETHS